MKKIIKIILWIVFALVLFVAGFLIYSTITDFQPKLIEKLEISGKKLPPDTSVFSVLSWNIGYCGMGKEQDFFFDGGKGVKPEQKDYEAYENGILNFIKKNDTVDFAFYQEIDIESKRSYYVNQLEKIKGLLNNHVFSFAKNYDVDFVPFPLASPMGKVIAGLATFSKHQPVKAIRYAFTANFSWPTRIFMLDRCFLLSRFKLKNGKELVLINTHNSAFDNTTELRKTELQQLKEKMLEEFNKGNYVIAGGDWNQNPLGFNEKNIISSEASHSIDPPMDKQILPIEWKWIFDPAIPTNRDANTPYETKKTKTTIIDFFVVSPNVAVISNKTIQTGFQYSDHQPIYLKVKLY